MAKNKIPSVEPKETPEEQATKLLAKYAEVAAEKKQIEERRKELETQITNLAVQNSEKWFEKSGTATFETGKIVKENATKFVCKEDMNWEKFREKYPTCVKFEFVTRSLKEFYAAAPDKFKEKFGIEQESKVSYKLS
jgi:hypothetical protein